MCLFLRGLLQVRIYVHSRYYVAVEYSTCSGTCGVQYMYMYLQACSFIWYMCMHMCAFHRWCAVTWDSTVVHTCVVVLINDVILCIPLLLATVQTHYSCNAIQ